MKIHTHIGVSIDGYISTPDGYPAVLAMPAFAPGRSHGFPEFIERCGAVVMGRTTFEPALGAPTWPWGELKVFVLTTRPLPAGTPAHVTSAADPATLLRLMQDADFSGDVHLVGGQQTIQAFLGINALDTLGVVILPTLLGDGVRLTPPGSTRRPLRLESTRTFPDGSVEHTYEVLPSP